MVSRRLLLRNAVTTATVGAVVGCLERDDLEAGSSRDDSDDATVGGNGGTVQRNPSEDDADADPDDRVRTIETAIHDQVNEVRREHDRDGLAHNDDIAGVAREHSEDMAERDYLSHFSPEEEGPGDRMSDMYPGYCGRIGENIANVGLRGADDEAVADRVVSGWMNSSGHRRNILNEQFDEQGIGVVVTEDGRVLATQKFCGTG